VRLFDEDVVWMATAPINRNLISALVKIVIQQLRTFSFSRKADPGRDPKRAGGQAFANIR
jgi:hypothetical protein